MRDLEQKAGAVFEILQDVYGQSPWSLEQIVADMGQKTVDYFFLPDSKQPTGFLSIQNLIGEVEITNIAVKKAQQGQGMASALMDFLADLDLPIFLEVRQSNLAAQALYQKFGFKEVGRRKNYYTNPSEDALLMKREGVRN